MILARDIGARSGGHASALPPVEERAQHGCVVVKILLAVEERGAGAILDAHPASALTDPLGLHRVDHAIAVVERRLQARRARVDRQDRRALLGCHAPIYSGGSYGA